MNRPDRIQTAIKILWPAAHMLRIAGRFNSDAAALGDELCAALDRYARANGVVLVADAVTVTDTRTPAIALPDPVAAPRARRSTSTRSTRPTPDTEAP